MPSQPCPQLATPFLSLLAGRVLRQRVAAVASGLSGAQLHELSAAARSKTDAFFEKMKNEPIEPEAMQAQMLELAGLHCDAGDAELQQAVTSADFMRAAG